MEAFCNGGGVPLPNSVPISSRPSNGSFTAAMKRGWLTNGFRHCLLSKPSSTLAQTSQRSDAAQANVSFRLRPLFPNSHFTGFDIDAASLAKARAKAASAGITDRITFMQIPAESIPGANRFDLVMAFNCVHDMANPRGALTGIRQALKPGGTLLWSEAEAADRLEDNLTPIGRTMYGASTMHCMTVSLAQGGEGLGSVIGKSLARTLVKEAGFASFALLPVKNPFHQIFVAYK